MEYKTQNENSIISIIVPVHNEKDEIQRCISSLCEQTYEKTEIIIVDDGSDAQTASILDNLAKKDDRIHVLHTINQGAARARLTGVKHSSGEYVMFCDADDYYEKGACEMLYHALWNSASDIAIGGYKKHTLSGEECSFGGSKEMLFFSGDELIQCMLQGKYFTGALWAKVYSKRLFNFDYASDVSMNEDVLINYCTMKNAEKGVFIDEIVYNYVERGGSVCQSTSKIKSKTDAVQVATYILKDAEGKKYYTVAVEKYIRCMLNQIDVLIENGKKDEAKLLIVDLKKNHILPHVHNKMLRFRAQLAMFSVTVYHRIYRVYDGLRVPKWDL